MLSFEPTSAKALFRRAQAHEQLGNKALAEADLVEGMRLKPSDTAFSAALAALRGEAVATEAARCVCARASFSLSLSLTLLCLRISLSLSVYQCEGGETTKNEWRYRRLG